MFFHCVFDSNIPGEQKLSLQLVVVIDINKTVGGDIDICEIYWPYTYFKEYLDGQNTLTTIIENYNGNGHIIRIEAPPYGKPQRCSSLDLIEALNIYNDPLHYNGAYTAVCKIIQDYICHVNDVIRQSIIQYCKQTEDITKHGTSRKTISTALPEPLQYIIAQKSFNMEKSVENTKKNSKRTRRESPHSLPQLRRSLRPKNSGNAR